MNGFGLIQSIVDTADFRVKRGRLGARDLIVFTTGLGIDWSNVDYLQIPQVDLPRDGKLKLLGFWPDYLNQGFEFALYHPSWPVVPPNEEPPHLGFFNIKMIALKATGETRGGCREYEIVPDKDWPDKPEIKDGP